MNPYLLTLAIILIGSFSAGLSYQSTAVPTNIADTTPATTDSVTNNTAAPANKSTKNVSVSEKKENFFAMMLPFIQQANQQVKAQRKFIEELKSSLAKGQSLSPQQQTQLDPLLKTYRVTASSSEQQINDLLIKVNTIPASLVLAQSANESAWGTSRFARVANNYFGQWCFSSGCGIVPAKRNAGAKHEVAKFSSALGSVQSYIKNLNRHARYQKLRTLRSQAVNNNQTYSGIDLAPGLLGYSERGEEYVKEISAMIRYNKLTRFDK